MIMIHFECDWDYVTLEDAGLRMFLRLPFFVCGRQWWWWGRGEVVTQLSTGSCPGRLASGDVV